MTTTTFPKSTSSGGPARSGSTPPAPPAPPPPPSGDDDTLLTRDELYDLLRLPAEKRTPEAIAHIPGTVVAGEDRYLRGQVLTYLAAGGAKPLGKRPPARRGF